MKAQNAAQKHGSPKGSEGRTIMHTYTNKWLRFVLVATVATCASCVTVVPPEPNNNYENQEPDYGFTRLIIWEW
jgi:hypothetical protein